MLCVPRLFLIASRRSAVRCQRVIESAQSFSSAPRTIPSINVPPTTSIDDRMVSSEEFRAKHQIHLEHPDRHLFHPMVSFSATPFHRKLQGVLANQGYAAPTPIQAQSWPIALQGRDLISVARTGSGKTCGFLLPAFHFIHEEILAGVSQQAPVPGQRPRRRPVQLLVLAPTRELGVQIAAEAEKFGRGLGLRTACLYGGASRVPQMELLRQGVDVVVATPGRALDLWEAGALDLSRIRFFVLDEADRM
jgi:ATP-dependent RNA helicase DDX5/DBP2